jgi:DNA primase
VGFTGRILTDDKKEAMYVNTPETDVYKKSAVLYGLDKAKGAIRQKDLAIIVEGNMDVIASHQFNIANVVAASGTALTPDQLALLKRFTTNLAIAFDQDAAGYAATLRGLDLARAQDFSIKIISLPPEAGKDPDEAVRKDPRFWQEAIDQAVGIMEWVYRKGFQNRHVAMPEDKKKIAADILPEIRRIVDPIERDHWVSRLAKDLAVSDAALREALHRTPAGQARPSSVPHVQPSAAGQAPPHMPEWELERRVFALALSRPALFAVAEDRFHLTSSLFSQSDMAALYERLRFLYSSGQVSFSTSAGLNPSQVIRPPAGLTPDEAKQFDSLAFLAEREFSSSTSQELERELERDVEYLRQARNARERRQLEQNMREAERVGDQERIAELLQEFERLR